VVKAFRGRANADGLVIGREIPLALACDIVPGESLIGTAMSNPEIWGDIYRALIDRQQNGPDHTGSASLAAYGFGLEAEKKARADGVRRVGERQVLAALTPQLAALAIRTDLVRDYVEGAELGPGFAPADIAGQWHGLLETSVVIEYRDVREIDWRQEIGATKVTLWVPASVLNELDHLAARGDSERVRDKANKFISGVLKADRLDKALSSDGLPIRDQGTVRLRVWAPVTMGGRYDSDHLDAAFALQERGVPVVLITADTGLTARAKTGGITTFRPNEQWRLKPELSPRERELELRLKRAELQRSPDLRLTARLIVVANTRAADIWLENGSEAGEARDVLVMWKTIGGGNLAYWNRLGGATSGNVYTASDGRFHQQVPSTLPPESEYQIAQVTFDEQPVGIDYEIWAAGSPRKLGRLRLVGNEYVAKDHATAAGASITGAARPHGEQPN